MQAFRDAFLDPDIMAQAWGLLLRGLGRTVLLSLLVLPLGLLGGLALALASRGGRWLRACAAAFVDIFRSVPPLALLVLIYGGLPFAGIDLGSWGSVALCFLLNTSAYHAEVLRAGIEAVSRGQFEATRALGLRPWQGMVLVVLPQAVSKVLPDILSNSIEVVKMTSLTSVVALPDLLFNARMAQSASYNATPVVMAAGMYFLLLWPVVRWLSVMEDHRAARSHA